MFKDCSGEAFNINPTSIDPLVINVDENTKPDDIALAWDAATGCGDIMYEIIDDESGETADSNIIVLNGGIISFLVPSASYVGKTLSIKIEGVLE